MTMMHKDKCNWWSQISVYSRVRIEEEPYSLLVLGLWSLYGVARGPCCLQPGVDSQTGNGKPGENNQQIFFITSECKS